MTVSQIQIAGKMTGYNPELDMSGNVFSGYRNAYIEILCDPPKNIAGKTCMMEALYMNHGPTITTEMQSEISVAVAFSANINSIWSQIYKTANTPQSQIVNGILEMNPSQIAVTPQDPMFNVTHYTSCGPTIVKIPPGPFRLRVSAYSPSGKPISGYSSQQTLFGDLNFFGSFQFTPIE